MKAIRSVLAVLCVMGALPSLADSTITQSITQVRYDGVADYLYFIGSTYWGATGCNPYYVEVTAGVAGRDKILAIALAAYAAGKTVQFQGTCNANSSYFDATYVIVTG